MSRFAKVFGLALLFAMLVSVAPAQAISPRNPYKSFNLSGINYASMKWEREHRGSSTTNYRYRYYNRRR